MPEQNSIIPTDQQHDEHFKQRCVDCETPFSKLITKAGDCEEGNLCQDCLEARQIAEETELP